MSTGYYLVPKDPVCPHCGHAEVPLAIGRGGLPWKFLLHGYADRGLATWEDWRQFLRATRETHTIQDEYGATVQLKEFVRTVEEWSGRTPNGTDPASAVARGVMWETFEGGGWD